MNTMKSVFSKIAEDKTELAKYQVELGAIDELKKFRQDTNAVISNTEKHLEVVKSAKLKLKDLENTISNNRNRIEELIRAVKTKADELGLNINTISEYKDSISTMKEVSKILGEIKKY